MVLAGQMQYRRGGHMDYSYHHQYNMYPDYYTPHYSQQYPSYPVPNFLSTLSSGTGTTPTLTPTTLANLEQTFIELQSVPVGGAGNSGGCEPHTQSGFVPPVIDPSSREQSQDSFESDTDWESGPAHKRGRIDSNDVGSMLSTSDSSQSSAPQRKYTRRNRNEKLSPEEEERRRVRRERNKLAAAKCRQRRVDHTNCLVLETEKLEAEQSDLENEIHVLQQQRDQLEFLLQAHVPICKVDPNGGAFKVKAEPPEHAMDSSRAPTTSSRPLPSSTSLVSNLSGGRPTSLPLDKQHQRSNEMPVVVSCTTGVTITTPSAGLFTYTSLDSLVEGSTGLTPLTSGPGVSCASQVQRSESESGSENVSSPTLISL